MDGSNVLNIVGGVDGSVFEVEEQIIEIGGDSAFNVIEVMGT